MKNKLPRTKSPRYSRPPALTRRGRSGSTSLFSLLRFIRGLKAHGFREVENKKGEVTKKSKIKKIAICTSVSFYKKALEIEKELKKLGFKAALPCTAYTMRKTGDYKTGFCKTWFADPSKYKRKAYLMRDHFKKGISSDAVLIANLKKKGQTAYIGGNVLMEMGIAFHHQKPIFVLNKVSPNHLFYEEILGMSAIFIHGDLAKIK